MRVAPFLLLGGCLAGFPVTPCDETAACRETFGIGWVCGADGYCDDAGAHPRCGDAWPPDLWDRPEDYGDRLVLGAMFDLGPDRPNLQSALLAVEQASESGLPGGIELAVVACSYGEEGTTDGLTVDEAVVETGAWLHDTLGVPAILGPATSGTSTVAYPALAPRDVLLISPSATSPQLVDIDGAQSTDDAPGLFWRPAPPDDVQALAIAADIATRGVTNIGIIYQDNPYGSALAELVAAQHAGPAHLLPFVDDNGRNIAVGQAVDAGRETQEVVFITSDVQDVVAFLNSAALIDSYTGVGIFLTDAAADAFLFDETTVEAKEVLFPVTRGSRPSTPSGPVFDAFVIGYAAAYDGEDPSKDGYNAYAYDAGWMAMYGLAWAMGQEGGVTGTTMARGLRRIAGPGASIPVGPSGWPLVLNAFQDGDAVDLDGASGSLDFDPTTGETQNPIEIWVPGDGETVPVAICQPDGTCTDL